MTVVSGGERDRSQRLEMLQQVADEILASRADPVTKVAVDGVDGAGKTHFADELAAHLVRRSAPVVRVSMDGFHRPQAERYRRGRNSPAGFFYDSYDYPALRRCVLEPLGCVGDRRIVRAVYDVHREEPVAMESELVPDGAVVVMDGIFLHRPELRDEWDYSVFLDVAFEVSIPRGAQRGYGDPDRSAPSNRRYVEGQRLYLDTCRPREHATVVVDNNDLVRAHIVRRATDASVRP